MKFFFTLCFVFVVVGCSEPKDINSLVDYKIIKEAQNSNFNTASVDIRLSKKASKEELSALANSLRKGRKSFEYLWIAYYLPDMKVGSGAWATTHFNPELEVKILGLTAEKEEQIIYSTMIEAPGDEVLGIWIDDRPYVGATITIYRENQKLYLKSQYKDGSSSIKEMTEFESTGGIKLVEKNGNPHGEYFMLDERGKLQAGGNSGIFFEYKVTSTLIKATN